MKKKYIWAIAGAVLLVIMVLMDQQKLKREEKPPLPNVIVGSQTIPTLYESYTWENGNKYQAKIDTTQPKRTLVEPFEDLVVTFPEEKHPTSYKIRVLEEGAFQRSYLPTETEEKTMKLPTYPGNMTFIVEAEWDKKRKASYIIPIQMEKKWSYQQWLNSIPEKYTLVMMGDEIYLPPHIAYHLTGIETISGDLENLQQQYPELNLTKLPAYFLFDQKSEAYRTNDSNEMIEHLSSFGSRYVHWLSQDPERLSVLIITNDQEQMDKVFEKIGQNPILAHLEGTSYPLELQRYYPEMPFDTIPVYCVFDDNDIIFHTQDIEELTELLETWKPS
ncbi:hypothetical protein SM124_14375 [Bacillus sp. 31A1R]|uniref:Uncharacterized protein n=1 Tax=Robertmurraya mangrovi TaxID=3098077 RepID=A0ABU5J0K5_9BACI|nr:hypothetical protein [Bacillus sp. 31A1R]MDZ5472916.1 hypothetical protein [Bacillus sp. 31A1R]